MSEIASRVNLIDVVVLILLLKVSYTSSHIGVSKQILPLFLLALVFTITFYSYKEIADFLVGRYSFTPSISEFIIYFFLAFILSIFYCITSRIMGFYGFQGEDKISPIEKVGGMLLGVLRATFIIGIILVGLILTPFKFIEDSVTRSYSGAFFVNTNLKVYSSVRNLIFREDKISYTKAFSQIVPKKKTYIFKSFDLRKKSRFFEETR